MQARMNEIADEKHRLVDEKYSLEEKVDAS